MHLHLADHHATEELARALAQTQPVSAVVYLQGELGSGKSTLARAWLRALGVVGTVRSPTYTLVERYHLPGLSKQTTNANTSARSSEALHLDLYRISDAQELEFLGLDDIAAGLWLIEWPERGASVLPAADLRIELSMHGPGRVAELDAASPTGIAWLSNRLISDGLRRFTEP